MPPTSRAHAGTYSLTKKRLRRCEGHGRRHGRQCRNLFADEEAIETVASVTYPCLSFPRRNLFADEEAIETVTVSLCTCTWVGRNLFADEEAIETSFTRSLLAAFSYCRNLFADEEAIETSTVWRVATTWLQGRNLFADEEAIETWPRRPDRNRNRKAGTYSLTKKRLRRCGNRADACARSRAGTYSLTKKRLRRGHTAGRLDRELGRNLFADEEAIETNSFPVPRVGLIVGRNLFADEEAIETAKAELAGRTLIQAGTYSLTKKRLRLNHKYSTR